METLGTIFEGLIRPLLLWIREDTVGPALAGLIVMAGAVIIVYALIETVRDFRAHQAGERIVGRHTDEEFAQEFNTITRT